MVVYGEVLFLENLITGSVLLYMTALLFRIELRSRKGILRLLGGSILCGMFAFVLFLPVQMPWNILLECGFAALVCLVVFGRQKLLMRAAAFAAMTCFLGGMTMALLLAFGHTGMYAPGGIYTGDLKAGILALFLGASVYAVRRILKVAGKVRFYQEHVFSIRIRIGSWETHVEGFLDTGNGLRDPVSGKSVAVASSALWSRLEHGGAVTEERFRMIPYQTVGAQGLLPAVRTDFLELNGRRLKDVLLAGAGEDLTIPADGSSERDGCCVLLSRDMVQR